MWIAKNSLTGRTYGKRFKDIMDCQKYIDDDLRILNYLFKQVLFNEDIVDGNIFKIRFGNVIRCWNISQKRWCDGFDF